MNPPNEETSGAVEACIVDIQSGLCCPRIHGCEQGDTEFCFVRQAFDRAGIARLSTELEAARKGWDGCKTTCDRLRDMMDAERAAISDKGRP